MWWDIIKSSREEAYAEFVREFGPEVELDSLTVNPYEDEKQVQIDSSDSEWVVNYAILASGKEQFTFESMTKYLEASFQTFVEGMFEMEYPERYQELLEMARGALPKSNRVKGDITIPLIHSGEAEKWLSEHEFYALNNERFDMTRRGVRRNLLKSVIEYYEGVPFEDADRYLSNVSLSNISDYHDLKHTFVSWAFILSGRSSVAGTWDRLKDFTSMMSVARAINSGDLDDTEFIRMITGPVRIRRIKED